MPFRISKKSSFKKEVILENLEDLFERFVEKFFFHRIEDGRYIVHLPSMHHGLVSSPWKVKVKDMTPKETKQLKSF